MTRYVTRKETKNGVIIEKITTRRYSDLFKRNTFRIRYSASKDGLSSSCYTTQKEAIADLTKKLNRKNKI